MRGNFGTVIGLFLIINQLSALDQSKDVEGKDCIVVEPIRNYAFNLTGLRKDLGYSVRSSDQPEGFLFNVCGQLERKCKNQSVAACVKGSAQEKKETIFGYQDKLYWNEGSLRFSYVGEKCNGTHNYTMNILLHCDYIRKAKDNIGAFHSSGSCEATIVMRTPLACLETPTHLIDNKCTVKGPEGNIYNFNSLKNYNHITTAKDGSTYIIGICNPVLYGHLVTCEMGSSVCHYDPTATNTSSQYKNVGIMAEDFKVEKDLISLTMTGTEPCDGTKKHSSKIYFECDKLAKVSYPTYHNTVDCVNIFTWPTMLACADKKPCQVSNPQTGAIYDFSSLMGVQHEAVNHEKPEDKILFSICSPAKEPCMKNGVGSCVVKVKNNQTTTAGIANDELRLKEKNPFLVYKNGAVCEKVGQNYQTMIDFICADSEADEGAVVIEDGCNITIHYKTLLACDYIKDCTVTSTNDQKIDLSPLIDYDGNYFATVNEKNLPTEVKPVQYVLNVCRPLNSKYSLNCRGSAGACRTVIEQDGKHEQELSLGHPDYSVSATKKGDNDVVIMKYFHGVSKCPTDANDTATSQITFYCNETAGLGNPILQSIDDCQYFFDFPTNILCNEQNVEVKTNSCQLVNDKTSVSIDLKLFGSNGVYKVGDKEVNICNGAESKFYTIVYKQSMLRIEFTQPNGNGNDQIDVVVQLKCGTNSKTTSTVDEGILVMHESELICPLMNIVRKAPAVTPPEKGTAEKSTAEDKTSSGGLRLGYVFLVVVVVLAFVAFGLVIRNPERREIIRNLVKFRSTSSPVQYSRVRLNEESLLLENNSAGLSDSDDDNILL